MANTLRFKRGLASGIPTGVAGEPLFTTDTFDLYIGNGTGNTRFQKYIASGTTSQLLRGDGSLLTMPIVLTSPATGQVLKFNGTNWVNDSDAGITGSGAAGQVAYFTGATTQAGSNNLFWDSANVRLGIGTNAPTTTLDIQRSGLNILKLNGGTGTNQGSSLYIQNGNFCIGDAASFLGGTPNTNFGIYTSSFPLIFYVGASSERARFHATGNFGINTGATDSGQRLQVTGTAYFSDSVGIGSTGLTGYNLKVSKNITGGINCFAISQEGVVQSDVNASVNGFYNVLNTQAATFTLPLYRHFIAVQGTIGAGSSITTQYGFFANSSLTGATNNYGFFGEIPSGTGRWNLYMQGTANNFINGILQLGSVTAFASAEKLQLTGDARIKTSGTGGLILEATSGTETPNLIFLSTTNRYNIDNSSGALRFFRENTDGSSGAVRMSLTDGGNLLIGSTSDTGEKLQVNGTMKVTGATTFTATGASISMTTAGDTSIWSQVTNAGGILYVGRDNAAGSSFGAANAHVIYGTGVRPIVFYTNSTERMRLDASGNLGLGVTPSAWGTMKVLQTTSGSLWTFGNTDIGLNLNGYYNGTNWIYSTSSLPALDFALTGTGTMIWRKAGTGTAGNTISWTTVMTLSALNNLLIGSTSDSGEKLQVNGTAKITGTNGLSLLVGNTTETATTTPLVVSLGGTYGSNTAGSTSNIKLRLFDGGSAGAYYGFGVSASLLEIHSNNSIGFFTGGTTARTERARIDLNGNFIVDTNTLFVDATNNRVGIGTTTPSETLHVVGNILSGNGGAFEIMNSSLANVTCIRATSGGTNVLSTATWGNNIAMGTETANDLILATNNTERMRLKSDGFLQHSNATNPTASVGDSYLQYSADITAGNAAPHFRTENGAVIKLYQQDNGVAAANYVSGIGSAVTTLDAFDGYTIGQVVKALRNAGILS
jgi:hypothetical protein